MSATPLREPAEESDGLYPGLSVNDGRVTGSIVVGQSRLPLWAMTAVLCVGGWDAVERNYAPSELGWTEDQMRGFLYHLTSACGEFARLLLVIADVERRRDKRHTADGWWSKRDRLALAAALRRALAAVEG